MFKIIIEALIIGLVIFVLVYLSFSFGLMSLNVSFWSEEARVGFLITFWGVYVLTSYLFFMLKTFNE